MRSLSVAFFIICFTTVVTVLSGLHVFPELDDTMYGYVGTEAQVNSLVMSDGQISAQSSGTTVDTTTTWFQQIGFGILDYVWKIGRSVLYLQDILVRIGVPSLVAWAVQSIVWTVYILDGITLWRGIPW